MRFDPDFLLEQVAKAPGEFAVRAATRRVTSCSAATTWCSAASPARRSCLDGAERRDGTIADLERFVQLGHTFDEIDTTGLIPCEPTDLPHDSRHLDMAYAQLTLTDKVGMAALFSGDKTRDSLAMSAIVFGGEEELRRATRRLRRRERQLAAAVRRGDARGDGRARRARPGHGRDAVPADGRHVAGVDPGGARAADRRAAGRRRLRAARAAGRAGAARLVPLAHRHAVGLAGLRRARVGHRAARVRAAGATVRPAVAIRRRRAHVEPAARRAGAVRGPQHDAAGVPRGRELPAALGRLAGVRTGRELRRSTCSTSRRCGSCRTSSRRSR